MSLLLLFGFYKLNLLANFSLLLVDALCVVLHLFYFYILFFQTTFLPHKLNRIDKGFCQKVVLQSTLLFFIVYILLWTEKIPPAGIFHANEVTIYDSIELCEYYTIPGCFKKGNHITIAGSIKVKYLPYNQKLIYIDYLDDNTKQKKGLSLRLNDPKLSWTSPRCYECRYFMNTVGPSFR